jgi:hypothetical protein
VGNDVLLLEDAFKLEKDGAEGVVNGVLDGVVDMVGRVSSKTRVSFGL